MVAAELRSRIAKALAAALPVLADQIEAVLSRLPAHPLDAPADQRCGEVRAHLERRGEPMGVGDLLIAAHTLEPDAMLVTDDAALDRVPGLRVETWLR